MCNDPLPCPQATPPKSNSHPLVATLVLCAPHHSPYPLPDYFAANLRNHISSSVNIPVYLKNIVVWSPSHVWLFCDPMDCSPPCSFCLWDFPGKRLLEWVAIPFFRESSHPRDWTHVSCTSRQFLYHWATRKALVKCKHPLKSLNHENINMFKNEKEPRDISKYPIRSHFLSCLIKFLKSHDTKKYF